MAFVSDADEGYPRTDRYIMKDHVSSGGRANFTRREFCRRAAALSSGIGAVALPGCATHLSSRPKQNGIRIEDVTTTYEHYRYRAPVKFAGQIMDQATILTVHCSVRTRNGKVGRGFGSMPFNHIFSYPSRTMSHEAKDEAMKALAAQMARLTGDCDEWGHPLDLNRSLAPLYLKAAATVTEQRQLPDAIPKLCTLVTSSAFDAAIHDAFGKVHGVSSFHTYGPQFMSHDLSHYLGSAYRGRYPSDYLSREPKPRMPLCHLISAVDPIEAFENTTPIRDGLPETLPEWIEHNGLVEFKIKVNGADLEWDVDRVVHIDRVTTATQRKRRVSDWAYVLDFNEKCPDLDYFMKFLRELKLKMPEGFKRIKYIEQPTSRDLKGHPEHRMHEAAKMCPVVIDESVIDAESVLLAREMGWTGAVLKSPKGLSNMILMACVAAHKGIFVCGGDMSCPGGALIQTANFQAHVPGITSIEANARQYLPQANKGWEARFPGIFRVADGMVRTRELNGAGLGA
jgi:L-alanine-DL-glutamate epimerase-like enolase superfamily enzyme